MSVDDEYGDVIFNKCYTVDLCFEAYNYTTIALGSAVQMNLVTRYGDICYDYYGTSEVIIEDIAIIV